MRTRMRNRALTWLLAVAVLCVGAAAIGGLRPAHASEKKYLFGDPAAASAASQVTIPETPADYADGTVRWAATSPDLGGISAVLRGGTNEDAKTFYFQTNSGAAGIGVTKLTFANPIADMSKVDSLTFTYSLSNSNGLPTGNAKSAVKIHAMNVNDGAWTVNADSYVSVTGDNATGFTLSGADVMKLADNRGMLECLQIEGYVENAADTILSVSEISYVEKAAEAYDITVNATRGTITLEGGIGSAVEGATVRFTATPDDKKELKSLKVTCGEGTEVPVTDEGNNVHSFKMPAGAVTITAVFDSDIYKELYAGDKNEIAFTTPTAYADPETAARAQDPNYNPTWFYNVQDDRFILNAYAGLIYGATNLTFQNGIEDASRIKKISIEMTPHEFVYTDKDYFRFYPVNADGSIGSAGYVEIGSTDISVREQKMVLELNASDIAKLANDAGGIKTLQWATAHWDGGNSGYAQFSIWSMTYELYPVGEFPVRVGTAENCKVTLTSGTSAQNGDTVTFSVTPDAKYRADEIKVTKADGTEITVTEGENGSYSFTMPAEAVTVSAVCVSDVLKDLLTGPADVTFSTPEKFANQQTADTFQDERLNPSWFYNVSGDTVILNGYSALGYGAANMTFAKPIADTSKVKSLTISLKVGPFEMKEGSYYRLYPVNADGTVVVNRYLAFDETNITVRDQRIELVLEGSEIDALTDDDGTLTRLHWATLHRDGANEGWAQFTIDSISYELYSESDYHTVTFKDYNGDTAETVKTARGVKPADFETLSGYAAKTGYRPVWQTEAGVAFDFSQNVTEDIVLVPAWEINSYTLAFEADGAPLAPITQEYGTALTLPSAPEKTGYTFAGWYRNAEGTGETFTSETMPAENIKLFAKYERIAFGISTSAEHADIEVSEQADYGDTVTFTVTPEPGYRVKSVKALYGTSGSEFELTESEGTYSFRILADTTIAVETEKVRYSVTVDSEHARVTVAQNATYGDTVRIQVTPDKGFAVQAVSVTDAAGKAVTVTKAEDGSYTFVMPAGAVTVTVTSQKSSGCGTVGGAGLGGLGLLLCAGMLLLVKARQKSV